MIAPIASENSLRNAVGIPWRHKGKISLFFLLVLGLGAAVTFLLPKTYRSEGKLLVRLGRENMALDPAATLGTTPVLTVQQTQENEINSVIEILRSRVLSDRIVDEVGPSAILNGSPMATAEIGSTKQSKDAWAQAGTIPAGPNTLSEADTKLLEEHEEAVRRFTKRLNVEAARKSNVVEVTYDASSPALAQAVVTRLMHYFQEDYVRLNRTPGAQEFLTEQTSKSQERLQEKEAQLRQLKDETQMAAPEIRQQIMSTRTGRLEDELLQVSAELDSEDAQVKRLREQLASLPATQVNEQTAGIANEAADGMRQQLYTLQMREQELASKYTEDHPQLQEVRQQIAKAKAVLEKEQSPRTQTKTGPSKPYEEVNLQLLKEEPVLDALKAKSARLKSELADQRPALTKFNADELRVAQLQREVQLEEANYRKYSDSLEQSRIDRAMADEGKSNINIVQPASFDLKPVKPNIPLNLALALVVGIAGGLGLAFAAESWNDANIATNHATRPLDLPPLPANGRQTESVLHSVESVQPLQELS